MTASSTIQALEWLDQNMHTSYPFAFSDDSPMTSTSGVALPSSFIVDMRIVVDDDIAGTGLAPTPEAAREGFFVSRISATSAGYVVSLSFAAGSAAPVVVAETDTIPTVLDMSGGRDAGLEARTFSLRAVGGHGNELDSVSGSVVVGTCADMAGKGTLEFARHSLPLLPSNVMLADFGLRSVTVGDRRITTDFTLAAGAGISLSVEDTDNGPLVTVSGASSSTARYESVDDLVAAVLTALGDPVRSVNGASPDELGNIRIKGGDCTQVDTDAGDGLVIRISNPCSRPCCGSASQAQMETALSQLEAAQLRLSEYYQALTNNVNAIQARLSSIIAAK